MSITTDKLIRGLPQNAWSMEEFSQKLGGRDARGIAGRIRKQLNADNAPSVVDYRGVKISKDAFIQYLYEANGRAAWSINEDIGQQIVDSFPKIPPKPDDVWSSIELGAALGRKTDSPLIADIKAHFDTHPDDEVAIALGIPIPKSALVEYDLNGDTITGIRIEHGQRLVEAYRLLKEQEGVPAGAWSTRQFANAIGADVSTAIAIIAELKQQFADPSKIMANYSGVDVPRDAIINYTYNFKQCVGIKQDAGTQIATAWKAKRIAKRPKPQNVYSGLELAELLGVDEKLGYSIIAKLAKQAETAPSLETVKYRNADIPVDALIQYDSETLDNCTGLRNDAALMVIKEYKAKQNKPVNAWSPIDFDRALQSKTNIGTGIIAMARRQFADPDTTTAKIKGVEIPRNGWIAFEHNGKPARGIDDPYALQLLATYWGKSLQKLSDKPYISETTALVSTTSDLENTIAVAPNVINSVGDIFNKGKQFAHEALAKEPPHTLFCAFLDPSAERGNPIELRMYRWSQDDSGELLIQRPPMSCSIPTGGSIAYGSMMLSMVEDHILEMPGVVAYKRLNNPPLNIDGDQVIPNTPITNGGENGVLEERHGTFHLHLKYASPHNEEIHINLGLVHDTEENRITAQQRADAALAYIRSAHRSGSLVTRNDVVDWLNQNFAFQSPYSNEPTRRVQVNFPAPGPNVPPGATNIVIYPPFFEGTPSSMWKVNIGFEYNDRRITGANSVLTIPLYILDGETALERVDNVANLIRKIMESQAQGGGQWAIDGDNRLIRRMDDADRAAHPHHVDSLRWREIRHLAATYELNHEVVEARPRFRTHDGYLDVTFGIRRTEQGNLTEEQFFERETPGQPPIALERSVYIPIDGNEEAAYHRASALVERVQELAHSYIRTDYSNFNPVDNKMRRPKPYQPSSFRNFLESAINTALEEPPFQGCTFQPGKPDRPIGQNFVDRHAEREGNNEFQGRF